MSIRAYISVEIDDARIQRLLKDRAFIDRLMKNLTMVDLPRFAGWAATQIRNEIMSGDFAPVGHVQRLIKGHGKVLYYTGDLHRNVSFRQSVGKGTITQHIGVGPGHTRASGGISLIADVLQTGTSFVPSPAQKKAVFAKLPPDEKQNITSQGSPEWTIPRRPFIEQSAAAKEEGIQRFILASMKALERTLASF